METMYRVDLEGTESRNAKESRKVNTRDVGEKVDHAKRLTLRWIF